MNKARFKKASNRTYYGVVIVITLAIIILFNIIVSFFDFRIDFTNDKRYSLTPTTINFLKSDTTLVDKIIFKIYLDGDFPAEIKRLQTSVKDKLDEFRYYAGSKIEYEFINPNDGSPDMQQTLKDQIFHNGQGIRPVNVTYQSQGIAKIVGVWPGAEIKYQDNTAEYIRFLEGGDYRLDERLDGIIQKSINNLEYELMRVLTKVTRRNKKKIAFIHGNGELGVPYTQGARKNIEDSYLIDDIKINGVLNGLDKYDGIIIANPTQRISDKDRFIIDQYLLKGGNIMIFNNPLEINNDTIRRTGKTHSTRKMTGIENLLFDYGIKINEDLVVDANYDVFAMPGITKGFVNWYFYVLAGGTEHPISNMINPVKLPYASSMQFVNNNNKTNYYPILISSTNSKSYGTVPLLSIAIERQFGENPIFQNNIKDEANRKMLGALAEGEFESAFKNRIVSTYIDNPNASFIEKSEKPGKLLVISNGTFFKNTFYDSISVPEENRYRYVPRVPRNDREIDELLFTRYYLGNFEFFENCIDYMLGESTLLSIRSRIIDMHPMDKLKIEQQGTFYKIINIIVPIAFILFLSIIVIGVRKYKYAKK